MTDTRCEPPEELRGVDGWHWVQPLVGQPHLARWHAADRLDVEPLWTSAYHVYSGTPRYAAREWGWRYLAPVATPAEVEALRRERNEALERAAVWHDEQAAGEDALAKAALGRDDDDYRRHRELAREHIWSAAAIRAMKEPGT